MRPFRTRGRVLSERGRLGLICVLTAAVAVLVAWAASDDPTPDPIPATASQRSQ